MLVGIYTLEADRERGSQEKSKGIKVLKESMLRREQGCGGGVDWKGGG